MKDTGNTTIFGYPGGAIMPFYDEIFEDADITSILTRHEQAAGHAAEGFAVASGKLGVVTTTSGPGATNLITALANAFYDSSPILAFSGQVPTKLIGNDAFQEADLIGSTMALTKHNYLVKDVNDLGKTVKEAIHIATTGRNGPVFIDLPKDVQLNEASPDTIPKTLHLPGYHPSRFSKGAKRQIKMALNMILKAKYPVILAGGGIILSNAYKELETIVNELRIPVVYTIKGKGGISDQHPYVLGMLGMHGKSKANFAMSESDLIIAIGCRFSDRITGKLDHFPGQRDAKIIHIDVDPAEIGKNVPVDLPVVADAKKALAEMVIQINEMKKNPKEMVENSWWYQIIKEFNLKKEIPNITTPGLTGKILPEKIIYELNKKIAADDIVVTEVGQNQMYAAHFLQLRKPRTWITSGGLGTMGFGFPASIGAKVAKPNKEVWCVAGDGSFQMNLPELATLKQHDIKVNIVILNNQYLGMVRQWQELFFDKRYAGTPLHTKSGEYYPDFVKLAGAYGFEGIEVSDPNKVGEALDLAQKSDESFLINYQVEPESNALPMLPPGAPISSYIDCNRRVGNLYDKYTRLPKRQSDLENYSRLVPNFECGDKN